MPAAPQHPDRALPQDVAGMLAWWREAGVDQVFSDDPHSWIAADAEHAPTAPPLAPANAPASAPTPKPPPPQIGGDRAAWPTAFDAFAAWWLGEPSLDLGGAGGRIAPRGIHAAEVMVLVPEPEGADAGVLLSGPQGKLLDAMLSACAIAPERAYIASVLPRHTPMPDWAALGEAGLGAIALHHIALAAPERVWVFGQSILSLIGHDPAKNPVGLRNINHEAGSVAVLAAGDLATLLARPGARAAWWARWLDWTGA